MSKPITLKKKTVKLSYLPFQLDREDLTTNPMKILKKSKELILSNGKYNTFIHNYIRLTQAHSFKLPEISFYPVHKTEDTIAISYRNFNYFNGESGRNIIPRVCENKSITNTSYGQGVMDTLEQLNLTTPLEQYISVTPQSARPNLPKLVICSNYNEIENEKELKSVTNNRNIKTIEELIEDIHDMDTIMRAYSAVYDIQFFPGNRDPKFCESMSFLERKLNELSNGVCENVTMRKNKSYTSKQGASIDLACESLCLKFTHKETGKIQKIPLPFSILPFFYCSSYPSFLLFLSQIIKMSKDINQICIDHREMLKYYPLFIKQFQSTHLKLFHEQSLLYTNEKMIKKSYEWITSESVYNITLVLPTMTCTAISANKARRVRIEKIMDKEMIIYLLKSYFVMWDFTVFCNFAVYKKFRNIIQSVLNYKSIDQISHMLCLDKPYPQEDISKMKAYEYFISNENWENFFHKMIPLKIKVTANDFKNRKDFLFELNLSETQRVLKLEAYWKAEEIIRKCLCVDNQKETLTLNFDNISGNEVSYTPFMKISGNINSFIGREENNLKNVFIEIR